MPEIDKNYLAGLYLDEITLDVMPQEYIDAALEVKLRYDACAPRAGYNCVQDRRVKGGFYYRKAPQGKGVNALPPSRLERALARSQEQPTPRSGMGFLSKAAIGAGVAIGGLALTGAVVNAGRSSEPYQEPVRQRPSPPPSNNTARNVGVGVGAAATVGLSVGAAIANKQQSKPEPQTITPQQSAQVPRSPDPVKTPEEEEGYREERRRIQAITELSRVGYDVQRRAYEQALSKDLEKAGVTPEGIEQKKKDLQFADDDEGFVRIDQVKENTADGVQLTKAARAKQSEDLQALYDKLKDNGVEGAIEFRPAIDKKFKKPLAASANKYTVDLRDGNPPVQVGEMRFRKNKDQIIGAIAEKTKNPTTESQPPTKSAKPKTEKTKPVEPPTPETRTTNPEEAKQKAIGRLGQAIRIAAPSADGYVNQSSLLNDKVLKSRLAGNDPVDLIAEGIEEGRIQVKKTGRNTYIRDVSVIPAKDFAAEALSLNDVRSKDGDRRVKDLRAALEYKKSRATTDEEKQGIVELEAAIAGIQEVKPERPQGRAPKPEKSEPSGDRERVYGGRPTNLSQATEQGRYTPPTVDPSQTAKPATDEQIAESNRELEREKQERKQAKLESQGAENAVGGVPRTQDNVRRPMSLLRDEATALNAAYANKSISVATFNAKVEDLRSRDIVKDLISRDENISIVKDLYQEKIAAAEAELTSLGRGRSSKADREAAKAKLEQVKQERVEAYNEAVAQVYSKIGIPDLLKEKKKSSSQEVPTTPASQDQSPAPEAPKVQPPAPVSNPTGNSFAPPADTANQETTRSQSTTPPAENPPASTKKRSRSSKSANTATSTEANNPDQTSGTPPSPQEIKKSLSQKAEAIANELNGFNISLKEANKQIADISKSAEGQAYLMADTTYKNLKEQIQNAPPKSAERAEIQKKLELRTEELLSRAGVRPIKGLSAPGQGDNSNLSDRQKRNKIESIAKGYEDRIAEIRSRNGSSAPPKGSQDALEKTQLEAKLTAAKEQLKIWDKKLEVDRRREDVKALRESIKNMGSEQSYPENVLSSLKEAGIKLSAFNKMQKETQVEAIKQAIAFQRQRIEELKGGDKTTSQASNDAIATSEIYLSAYWEIRDKYRRVS